MQPEGPPVSSKDFFDRVAPDWDEMRENYYSDDVRTGALAAAAVRKGKVAADVGAGTIEEMVRILKPAGKLVITDADEHEFEFLREEHHDRWMGFKRIDIREWFRRAGLTNIRVDSIGSCCEVRSDCGDEFARIGIFVASGEKSADMGGSG